MEVSIGKMSGTSCSSQTLLNVTHTDTVTAQQYRQSRNFLCWPRKRNSMLESSSGALCHLMILVLLILSSGCCEAAGFGQRGMPLNNQGLADGSYKYYAKRIDEYRPKDARYNNYYYNDQDVREPPTDILTIEKDTDVKTVRFANPNDKHHKKHHKSKHSHKAHHQKNSQDFQKLSLHRNNHNFGNEAVGALQNNDVRKIGMGCSMSTQDLKILAELVAQAILADAETLTGRW